MIIEVSDNYLSIWEPCHSFRVLKLASIGTFSAELKHKSAFKVKDLNTMVIAVCDDETAIVVVNGNRPGHVEFPTPCAFGAKCPHRFAKFTVVHSAGDVDGERTTAYVPVSDCYVNSVGSSFIGLVGYCVGAVLVVNNTTCKRQDCV